MIDDFLAEDSRTVEKYQNDQKLPGLRPTGLENPSFAYGEVILFG